MLWFSMSVSFVSSQGMGGGSGTLVTGWANLSVDCPLIVLFVFIFKNFFFVFCLSSFVSRIRCRGSRLAYTWVRLAAYGGSQV